MSQIRQEITNALAKLKYESRVMPTPWNRIVRGLGLGQHPMAFQEKGVELVQEAFHLLTQKTIDMHIYTLFSSFLCDLINLKSSKSASLDLSSYQYYVAEILEIIDKEDNCYFKLMQYSIFLSSMEKIGVTISQQRKNHIFSLMLKCLDKIEPENINDENRGLHGEYEKLSAYTSLLMTAVAINERDFFQFEGRNLIEEGLASLSKIPSPFFKGRGGSMLFSAIALIGQQAILTDRTSQDIKRVFDAMDSPASEKLAPVFPQPMTNAFVCIYPLLTMLNAVALVGDESLLEYQKDRIQEAKQLLQELRPVERTHMTLYFIIAIYNLGRLDKEIDFISNLLDELFGLLDKLDPSEDYFLHGISFSYIIETAIFTGQENRLNTNVLKRLSEAFFEMDKTAEDELNRYYPLAYSFTMLGELNQAELLFLQHSSYANKSPMEWVIEHASNLHPASNKRLYMLNNSLINFSLRMNEEIANETTGIINSFRFPFQS